LNSWRVIWRAVTQSRLSMIVASIVVAGAIIVTDLVMTHGYKIGVQWGPETRFELAPAATPSPTLR